MHPRTLRTSIYLLAPVLAATAGCSTSSDHVDAKNTTQLVGIVRVSDADRKPAPTIAGRDLNGKRITTAQYAGKTIVVNAWGSWCSSCRAEAPALQKVSSQFEKDDVQFIGVDVQDNPAAAKAFNRGFQIRYPSVDDYSGRTLLGFRDSLPTQATPTTWIIDSRGRVAVRIIVDGLTATTLAGLIDDVRASVAK